MKKSIDIGDDVVVFWNGDCLSGKVEYMPLSAGDCWIIIDSYGKPNYIQQFNKIEYNPPPETDPTKIPF